MRDGLSPVEIRSTRRGLFDRLIPVLVTGMQPDQVLGLKESFPRRRRGAVLIPVTSTGMERRRDCSPPKSFLQRRASYQTRRGRCSTCSGARSVLKEFKRMAMRADKADPSVNANIHLASAVINSK
jgi:hypothetical protein